MTPPRGWPSKRMRADDTDDVDAVSLYHSDQRLNVAVTFLAAVMSSTQALVPLQAPLQPEKL